MRVAPEITVAAKDRVVLQRWSRGRSTPARLERFASASSAVLLDRIRWGDGVFN